MFRALLPAVLVLFLASAASAGPDDPFDARVPGALRPAQTEAILALEDGRYALRDGHFVDSRAVDPARPLLTNARVAELLATGAAAGGAPDPAYQRALARGSNRPNATLDFGASPPPGAAGGTGAAAVARAPEDAALLQAHLLERLSITGTKRERDAINEALGTIVRTKIGRELAEKFVGEAAKAEIVMGEVAGSTTVMKAGKRVLWASGGNTTTWADPPKVLLNRDFLDTDAEYRRVTMAVALAHELFGHAFQTQRALKAGLPAPANYFYRGDELGAELINWTMEMELAGQVLGGGNPDAYLDDAEGYLRALWTNQPYYALTLSRAEMRNPVAALRARRAIVRSAFATLEADIKNQAAWRPIRDHFVGVHRIPRARFGPADEELRNYFTYAIGHRKTLVDIKEALASRITFWTTTPEGKKEVEDVIRSSGAAFFKKSEADMASRAKALRRLRKEKGALMEAPSKPPKGQHDLIALSRMYAEDLAKLPEHWKK